MSLQRPIVDEHKAQVSERKRLAYHSSDANIAHAAWTATRIRDGSRWVGRVVDNCPTLDSTTPIIEVVDPSSAPIV